MSYFDPEIDPLIRRFENPAPPLPLEFGLSEHDSAYGALHNFSLRVHETRALDHPLRTAEILYDFVGEKLPNQAYQATLLHDVVSRFNDEDSLQRSNAKIALQTYFNEVDEPSRIYTSALLADMDIVESAAETYRSASTTDERLTLILQGEDDKVLPTHWLEPSSLVDPQIMQDLLGNVNLESVLIKAAELLDNLRHPAKKDRSLLQDIFEAESFYAPLCEILGFDGFSMALRDEASSNRFRKSGSMVILEEAIALRERVENLGSIDAVLTTVFGEDYLTNNVIGKLHNHAINVREIVASVDNQELFGVARTKSIGSIALKMLRYGDETPMDIVGITFIAEDIVSAGSFFAKMIKSIEKSRDVEFESTPNRSGSIIVRGDKDYVAGFVPHILEFAGKGLHITEQESGAYQVAKVILMVNGIPTEIQIQTKQDRKES